MDVTENVLDFMTSRIFELPKATQKILTLTACIGNRFDLMTLAGVRQQQPDLTVSNLNRALQNRLILPLEDAYLSVGQDAGTAVYCFLHDRVHQAVYSMIPTKELSLLYLNIDKILMKTLPQDRMGELLLEIFNHLNNGQDYITERLNV